MGTPEPTSRCDGRTTHHVRRAVAGDDSSLDWLVRRLHPLLVAHAAYRLTPDLRAVYDPEDLVNDAWMVTLHRLGDLRPRRGRMTPVVLKFLATTLLYRINELHRRDLRRAVRGDPDRQPTPRSGVITAAARGEREGVVTAALSRLPERDREILLLRGIEQHGPATVGTLLGLQPSAVAMRFQRALQRLRREVPDSVFDDLAGE